MLWRHLIWYLQLFVLTKRRLSRFTGTVECLDDFALLCQLRLHDEYELLVRTLSPQRIETVLNVYNVHPDFCEFGLYLLS